MVCACHAVYIYTRKFPVNCFSRLYTASLCVYVYVCSRRLSFINVVDADLFFTFAFNVRLVQVVRSCIISA